MVRDGFHPAENNIIRQKVTKYPRQRQWKKWDTAKTAIVPPTRRAIQTAKATIKSLTKTHLHNTHAGKRTKGRSTFCHSDNFQSSVLDNTSRCIQWYSDLKQPFDRKLFRSNVGESRFSKSTYRCGCTAFHYLQIFLIGKAKLGPFVLITLMQHHFWTEASKPEILANRSGKSFIKNPNSSKSLWKHCRLCVFPLYRNSY